MSFLVNLRKSYPTADLQRCSANLRSFLSSAQFDETILGSQDGRYTRISIVMPAYNQVRFIERSILSVLNQNYPNLQFIIMDGGSTDGTLDIIHKYEKYLIWRSEPDRGQSDAINKAVMLADGELIGWQNSDDVYFPGALHHVNRVANLRQECVLYSGTVVSIDTNEEIQYVAKYLRPSVSRLLYEGFIMSSQAVFWRRAAIKGPELYDPNLHHAMDIDFWIRVLRQGPAEFIPQTLGGFRRYEGTKTSAAGARGRAEAKEIRKKYGVDEGSVTWTVMRNLFRISRLVHWTLMTRPHCLTSCV